MESRGKRPKGRGKALPKKRKNFLYMKEVLLYTVFKQRENKPKEEPEMTIKTTNGKTTITIGAHNKRTIEAAAQRAADLWSPGEWAEVCTTLGDPVFWITPSGTEYWDM